MPLDSEWDLVDDDEQFGAEDVSTSSRSSTYTKALTAYYAIASWQRVVERLARIRLAQQLFHTNGVALQAYPKCLRDRLSKIYR